MRYFSGFKKNTDQSSKYTLTCYKDSKSRKVQKVQVDTRDQSVKLLEEPKEKLTVAGIQRKALDILKETYLPKDFPDSVTKQYLPFTLL